MKNPPIFLPRRRKAFALIIVLGAIVLLVALAVGFLGRVTTERTAAAGYSSAVSARQLGDMAVNLVQGQINMATAGSWDQSSAQNQSTLWTSQPGLITNSKFFQKFRRVFKLYSASDMVQEEIPNPVILDTDVPADWASNPSIFVDLNAPVAKADGSGGMDYVFPIVDPAVIDPASPLQVEGFSVDSSDPRVGSDPIQKVPMPVKWLYVLQDGKMTAPTGSGNDATIPGETKTNPIIGRVGFWTDDDTSKINVNTAAGAIDAPDQQKFATYWDTPRMVSQQEQDLSDKLPVRNEFQRYPGHPATVNLGAVLKVNGQSLFATRSKLFELAPRYKEGGSRGGIAATSQAINLSTPTGTDTGNARLYASVDEIAFDPKRIASTSGITPKQVELSRFGSSTN